MIDFKKVALTDKDWMDPLLAAANLGGCHQNFTNIFAWSEINKYSVARVYDYLVVKGGKKPYGPYYFYPAGSGDIRAVLEEMKKDAAERQHRFRIAGASPENITELNRIYPGGFLYQESRNDYDYVYFLEKLVTLRGKKLQAKRNHINRFKANNNWSFEEITPENLGECWEMNEKWCKSNDCADDEKLSEEYCAVRRCFKNYAPLGLEGGLIRVDGRVIAFTMGDVLNSDTYVIHIEKAFAEIQGAYQIINQEFAALIQRRYPSLIYVNREEDAGLEGLRKAKLSYHPDKMEIKFIADYAAG